jgi:hypothetical protein
MIESKEIMVEKVNQRRSRFKHCLDLINFVEEYMEDGERRQVVDS